MAKSDGQRQGLDAAFGGRCEQRCISKITTRDDGRAFRLREYCNPFQTCKAYGRDFRQARNQSTGSGFQ